MTNHVTVTVWSDYVCPWCYIGLTELKKLKGELPQLDVELDWRPFLLRPETPDTGLPLPSYIEEYMARADNPLKLRAKALGLTINQRANIPSTRRAHQATEFARAHGKLQEFHGALLLRYWTEMGDLHDWALLKAAAAEAGLDGEAMQREVDAGAWREPFEAGLAAAKEIGVTAVPTFVVGRFVIQGAQEGRVFRQAFERMGLLEGQP
jgi:predicted DsbA family dithiol-disulfide isomerase